MRAKLTYFKGTGKYYGEGALELLPEEEGEGWWHVFDRVEALCDPQQLPGLASGIGRCCFVVFVQPPPDHPHGFERLLNVEHAVNVWCGNPPGSVGGQDNAQVEFDTEAFHDTQAPDEDLLVLPAGKRYLVSGMFIVDASAQTVTLKRVYKGGG